MQTVLSHTNGITLFTYMYIQTNWVSTVAFDCCNRTESTAGAGNLNSRESSGFKNRAECAICTRVQGRAAHVSSRPSPSHTVRGCARVVSWRRSDLVRPLRVRGAPDGHHTTAANPDHFECTENALWIFCAPERASASVPTSAFRI